MYDFHSEKIYYYCKETNKTYYGKQLLECGITLNLDTVYAGGSRIYHFKEVNS